MYGKHKYIDTVSKLEENKKGLNLTAFVATASSLFLWGIILFLASSVYGWVNSGPYGYGYKFVAVFGLFMGNIVMGRFSDRYGRKRIFILTVFLSAVGLYGAIASFNVYELFISVFIANFALGGDETVILAYVGESVSFARRSQYIVFITNMANFGVFLTAFVEFFYGLDIYASKFFIFSITSIVLVIVFVSRWLSVESPMWAAMSGRSDEYTTDATEELWNYSGRKIKRLALFEQISTATTIITGFFLLNIYFGSIYANQPFYFAVLTTFAGTVSGVALSLYVKKVPHRILPVISFPLMAALLIFLAVVSGFETLSLNILIWILIARAFLSEIGWGSREVLQVELNHTMKRGTGIGNVRAFAYGILIIIYILTTFVNNSMEFYFMLLAMVEIFGAIGAISWYLWGVETGTKAIL